MGLRELMILKAEKGGGGGYVQATAEGNPLSFNTNVSKPLKSLLIPWTPTQESGAPSPSSPKPISGVSGLTVWQSGKNLLNLDRQIGTPVPSTGSNTTNPRKLEFDKYYVGLRRDNYYYPNYVGDNSISNGTIKVKTNASNEYGLAFPIRVTPNQKYTISAVSENALFGIGYYDENWNYISSNEYSAPPIFPITFTAPANAYCATLVFRGKSSSTYSTYSNIQVEVGDTASEYSPYTGTTIPVTFPALGKNLLKLSADTLIYTSDDKISFTYTNTGYVATLTGTFAFGLFKIAEITQDMVGKKYIYSATVVNTNDSIITCNADGSGRTSLTGGVVQQADVGKVLAMRIYLADGPKTVESSNCQVEQNSSATSYEPYTNTVYGGSLDLVSGVLTVTQQGRTYDGSSDEDWTISGSNTFVCKQADCKTDERGLIPLCDKFTMEQTYFASFPIRPKESKDYATDTTEWRAWLAEYPIQVVYVLATPQTVQLTPQQITALVGDNVLWSDTNGSNTAVYLKRG